MKRNKQNDLAKRLLFEVINSKPDSINLVESIIDAETTQCCQAERLFLAHLEGGCSTAIGCWGRIENRRCLITGYAATSNGSQVIRKSMKGMPADSNQLALHLAEEFEHAGAKEMLTG